MRKQGPGYRDFEEWIPPRFIAGERRASAFMTVPAAAANHLTCIPAPGDASAYTWHPAEFLFRHAAERHVPIYIILDPSIPFVQVAKPFPKNFGLQIFVHTNEHKPPHIHIDCPPGTPYTKYQWPELTPLPGQHSLRTADENNLHEYINKFRSGIERQIVKTPWK